MLSISRPLAGMVRPMATVALVAALMALPVASRAQDQSDLLIVLDASGSMWGQVDGRAKIDLARDALSQVLSEATPDMQIGMIAYGHRQRGQCSDIELLVPSGPATATVPAILQAARGINPVGRTPLTDAVMQAAQTLRFTENAATVVLLTDGVETCEGDPCALGRMLEQQGIDFTAHVVGFDMTDAEQQTVSCLADTTGGLFLAANDADDLARALRETIIAAPVVVPDPGPVLRPVNFILRDTAGGPPINGRQIDLQIDPVPGGTAPEGLRVTMDQPVTAVGQFLPGRYTATILRQTDGSTPVSMRLDIEVPEGTGPVDLDIVIGARLRLTALAHSGLPMPEGSGNLPFAAYGSDAGRAYFTIHPVVNGAVDTSVDYGGINSRDVALPPGDYFIRGGLSRSFSRERLVRVLPGQITDYVFDFEAARVFVDMRDPQGAPVQRLSSYFYDGPDEPYFLNGGGRGDTGLLPFYLPVGTWRIDAGQTGGGTRRAQAVFDVTRPGEDIILSLTEGARVDAAGLGRLLDDPNPGCIADLGGEYGCLVEAVTPSDFLALQGIDPQSAEGQAALAPSFTGAWQSSSGPIALVQDGRRVWGDVPGGVLAGEVAADGVTLRGIWDTGFVELRLSPDGQGMAGSWGRGFDPALGDSAITARRISGGAPRLERATGTDADLPEAFRGGLSPVYEAFMAPARATGDAVASPDALFAGVWSSSHQTLTLFQQGRRVWGERARGTIEGEVSGDGTRLRGTWTTGSDWGTFEFVLDDTRQAFAGRWGRGADAGLGGGSWTGSRQTFLGGALTRPVEVAMARPSGAVGPEFEAFLQAVRDGMAPVTAAPPGVTEPPVQPAIVPAPTAPGSTLPGSTGAADGPDLNPGFQPLMRRDFADATGRTVLSVAFSGVQPGGDLGYFADGFVWLRDGWCGAGCAEQVLPLGGPALAAVPNAFERLARGGVFPALSPTLGQLVFEVATDRIMVHEIVGPYSDATQLGAGRDLIQRTFGTFGPVAATPPGLAGWPVLPVGDVLPDRTDADLPDPVSVPAITPEALPTPDALPIPVQAPATGGAVSIGGDVAIGVIEGVPIGVFSDFTAAPGEGVASAVARVGTDANLRTVLTTGCIAGPMVFYSDGLVHRPVIDSEAVVGRGEPLRYISDAHLMCDQSGPIFACTQYDGAPGDQSRPVDTFSYVVAGGPDGSFGLSRNDETKVFVPCYGAGGLSDVAALTLEGRPLWQAIVERPDGGTGLVVGPDGTVSTAAPTRELAPPPVRFSGSGAFSDLAGIWAARDPSGNAAAQALSCFEWPGVLHPDGTLIAFQPGPDGLPQAQPDYLSCTAMDDCHVILNGARDAVTGRLSMVASGPREIALCQSDNPGSCRTMDRCDPMPWTQREINSGLAEDWTARVMQRN